MRFNMITVAAAGIVALVGTGCASSQGGGSQSVTAQAALGKLGPALLQWTGNFRSQRQADGAFGGMQQRNQASGRVILTSPAPNIMRAQINVSVPFDDAVQLLWTVSSGSCGSNSIPLMSATQFPQLTVINGQGSLDQQVSLAMPTSGTYHVNIFQNGSNGQDESGVLTCADLRLEQRSK